MTMDSKSPTSLAEIIFAGDSEMAARMRSHDWSQTPLGAVETWFQSLRTAVGITLTSRQPMFVWWGDDLINLYNDAYSIFLRSKHPAALGQPASYVWQEIWDQLEPRIESTIRQNEGTFDEAFLFIMERNGFPEETYVTFSYSSIPDDRGGTGGLLCACSEDTRRVLNDRLLRTIQELGAETTHAKTVAEACQISTDVLAKNLQDIPFALIYWFERDAQQAHLMSTTRLEIGTAVSPAVIELADEASDCWLLNSTLTTGKVRVVDHLIDRFGALPGGAWDVSPDSAIVLPLTRPGQEPLGVLIAGISPYRQLDEDYRGFFNLVAGQVIIAIANILASEEERKRAVSEAARSAAVVELARAKTLFFSNVSHEFRTPLTLMLSPAEDALADRDDPLSPNQRQRIEMVQRNGLRLLRLVNMLLDFSRIESDRLQATYEPTDLATFTAELASVFRSAIEQAGMSLIVDCPPLAEPIYVDREMWEKIVLNLLSNAFKFTFFGEITIQLHQVENRELGKLTQAVELSVQDTGIGIPAAEIPHLFERFHQVKGTQGRTIEGSGIGLSLVQELVKLHGGTVQVRSFEGEGSCFRVSIPMGYAHLPADQISSPRTEGLSRDALVQSGDDWQNLPLPLTATGAAVYKTEAFRWLSQEQGAIAPSKQQDRDSVAFSPTYSHLSSSAPNRILLVDDNADMRDYVTRLLSQRWQVETAANGAIALNLIQRQLPDLVLTDVMMPEMDGLQLLKMLRANPVTKSIPIIMLSAQVGETAMVEGLEAGADDYLIKPFSARELMARVETHLQMSQLRQQQSANRFKNEFLMTVTHELQAPLALILGWVRLLQTESVNPDTTAQALATIERNATIESKLIRDLLDVLGLLSGKVQLKSQMVDLALLIQGIVAPFRKAAEAKKIQLIEITSNIPQKDVIADGSRLKQILANLLDNAIKFTPQGGQVTIQLEYLASEVQITVADTGIGIPPDFLPYVFDRFTQAEVPSRHSPGGVGLGLALARLLVELHHGTLEVFSEGEGQGATFTVRLPLRMDNS